jgi:hypothetical protein
MKITRFKNNPIIKPEMDTRMGNNINGPSLIRTPKWLTNPLGKYYLYFSHHQGQYIRLAFLDTLEGPWKTYKPGTLKLEQSYCIHHIASPDIQIDNENQLIRMYYHGPISQKKGMIQISRVATSKDGIQFTCNPKILGSSYFRVFNYDGSYYALGMPGIFYRSKDGLTEFIEGPTLFTENMRHSAVKVDGDTLSVFFSNVTDCPERILLSKIDLEGNWMDWSESEAVTVLEPEMDYEGVDLHLEPSVRGWAPERVRQLRDPGIFLDEDRLYLLYSVAGENGIAIAEITEW